MFQPNLQALPQQPPAEKTPGIASVPLGGLSTFEFTLLSLYLPLRSGFCLTPKYLQNVLV